MKPAETKSEDLQRQLDTEVLRRRRAESINQALFNISRAVHTAPSLETLYADIHKALDEVLDLTNFYIGILDREHNEILLPYYIDQYDGNISRIPNYTESHSLTGIVVQSREPVFLTEKELQQRAAENRIIGTVPRIWLGIPLIIDGEVIGVMASQSYDDPGHFDRRDLDILTSVSEQIAMAIQRKRAEMRLRNSEDRFRRLQEASFGGIGIHDKGVILDANQGLSDMTGYTRDELVGMDGLALIAPSWRDMVRDHIRTGYEKAYDAEGLRKDGTIFPLEIRGKQIPYRGRNVRVTEFRDITDRKQSEEALRYSEEKYRSILEGIEDAYFEVDLTGTFTFLNDATCRQLGYDRDEMLAMDNRGIMNETAAQAVLTAFGEVHTTGKPIHLSDLEVIRKDGSAGWVEMIVSLIRDGEGRPVGFRGVGRDITERKQAERDRQVLEEELRRSQRLESLGKLAGGIAHDFNNLLMGIQGRVSLMLLDTEVSHPSHSQLLAIEETIEKAAGLTRQLLGLARGGKYEVKPVDLNTLVQQGLDMFGRTRKELLIRSDLDPALWVVAGDRSQLDQVLLNLFINAWQAMPSGGELSVQSRNIVMDADQTLPFQLPGGRYTRISVSDTGTGMDETIQEHIFDPFFTTRDKSSGMGLGLASVYGIINNHGGFIRVNSEKNRGTTIHFFLPAVNEGAARPSHSNPADTRRGGTVLLVDDEEMILDVGKGILQHLGYTPVTAASGSEAIDIFREKNASVVLLIIDMIMPGMNGGELFDRIRTLDPRVPVLLASGYSMDEQASAIMERGCNGFIQKPFTISHLSQKIREIIPAAGAAVE
jgi:two-component system cell cycle sensor histidine kinase/response regulator CckA